MRLSPRLYVLLLAPLGLACSAEENSKDPVFSARFQNEKRIGEENITKRQLRDAELLVEVASLKMELLEISQIAQRKATSADTRYVAQNAIAQLSARLQELKTLAQQKDRALPTGLGESQAREVGELTALNGPAFDQKYAELFSSLTDKAVDTYEDMADEAYDGDIRALAARQLPALKDQHTAGEALQDKLKP